MAVQAAALLLLVVSCGARVPDRDGSFVGGPVAAYDLSSAQQDLPLPGKEIISIPKEQLTEPASRGYFPAVYRFSNPAVVTLDDLDKVDSEPQPPLRFAFPVRFQQVDDKPQLLVVRGLADWLPAGVVAWLPSLPSLPSLSSLVPSLPSYIPGVELEAEVHRQPGQVPHLPHVPTPAELLQRVNHMVREVQDALHKRQQQLVELIKCTCPRPARCDGLFQEFLSISNPVANPSSTALPGEPGLSFFAELTKPNGGHGPGFGFFVDQSGPHIGHHVHNGSATATASSTASAGTAAPSAATPATSASAAPGSESESLEFPAAKKS